MLKLIKKATGFIISVIIILFFIFTVLCIPVVLLLPQSGRNTFYKYWGRISVWLSGSKVSVRNQNPNLILPLGNIVYLVNHSSYIDIPILMGWLIQVRVLLLKAL
jgi:1-acyl-sn-glycerol-3-phosphate acyltransferase